MSQQTSGTGNELAGQYRWIPLMGNFSVEDDLLIFHGEEVANATDPTTTLVSVGNLLCDAQFGGGVIEADITFPEPTLQTACGLMLFYHPVSRSFVEAQFGGGPLASVFTFANGQWTSHGAVGENAHIEANRKYNFRVTVSGSNVAVAVDGVNVLATNLPFPLPRGQAGVWCRADKDVHIERFRIRAEKPKAFVVMQFTAPFNDLYTQVIRPVCESLGFLPNRADETSGPGLIIADIENQILEAQVVIADITPQNPNVYYEVGYSHALRKPTILIAESPTKLPFDVSPFRTLFYENSIAGKSRVEAGLRKHLEAIADAHGLSKPTVTGDFVSGSG